MEDNNETFKTNKLSRRKTDKIITKKKASPQNPLQKNGELATSNQHHKKR